MREFCHALSVVCDCGVSFWHAHLFCIYSIYHFGGQRQSLRCTHTQCMDVDKDMGGPNIRHLWIHVYSMIMHM